MTQEEIVKKLMLIEGVKGVIADLINYNKLVVVVMHEREEIDLIEVAKALNTIVSASIEMVGNTEVVIKLKNEDNINEYVSKFTTIKI